ncbi:LacI family DNA-binding transcriptional regulator [Psychrobacillus sp. BL-248-WT-3]|uniref:LacI family DNA-binding transcriptional regulator n=1 Tax=Psychrobacillus sp. BL-248-WT-3 TaxID=2725306 RepID=UPI00146F16A6|nr:LacI family DNA-binding transcriptional regulator [Psychrobacillus sp. BL-248-WT-3]NME06962.1 LacI family transcriptional regulator [Psychrobacillus sp. BL-248-WT-3]
MVSSKDVAKLAGVSQATVSRVLNTPELVKKPTLEKVQRAINDLNYIPNAQARSLVQNKSRTIALLSGPLHNPFFVDTTTAIVNYASQMDYRIQVQFVNDLKLNDAYTIALEHKVDGIILSCILKDDPIFEKLKRMNVPFITYNRKHQHNEFFVEIDNYEAGYLSAKHMIDQGHKLIAWIGGPQNFSTFHHRFEGFSQALKDHEIMLDEKYIFNTDTTSADISASFYKLMKRDNPPTAICAGSDSLALNTIDSAIRIGLVIPKDISIIGIDNVDLSSHGSIQLTTVGSVSGKNLGYLAIEKLIDMIENKNNGCVKITEPVKIFPRSTTSKYKTNF